MKNPKALCFLCLIVLFVSSLTAQERLLFTPEESKAREAVSARAQLFADSMINSLHTGDIEHYLRLSYPGVVSYYGGKNSFLHHLRRSRENTRTEYLMPSDKTELIQLINDDAEWQSVIKKTTRTTIDGRNATITSYMVGQSRDNGMTWSYFDMAHNSVANIMYIMPDAFRALRVPDRQIVFREDAVVVQ